MYLYLLNLFIGVSAAANVCKPTSNSSQWAFTVDQDSSFSCSSSAGKTNDLDTSPTSCDGDPASVRIEMTKGKAECLVAKSQQCKIPMHDFVSLDYDFFINQCNGIWAAPLWMTPDKWQWGPGSGEIDSEEFCSRDSLHLNFAGGGSQKKLDPSIFSIDDSEGHITVRKDEAGIVTITACTTKEAEKNQQQCMTPSYHDCSDCLSQDKTYGCWCNANTNPPNIYGSGGCAPNFGGDCMWTLVSDAWNGVSGDAGYAGCMTAVPSLNLPAGKPNLNSNCSLSVERIVVRGGGVNESIRWGAGSPSECSVLTTATTRQQEEQEEQEQEEQEEQEEPTSSTTSLKNIGNISALVDLVERLFSNVPSSTVPFQSPFTFALLPLDQSCGAKQPPCFILTDDDNNNSIHIEGTTASELGAGLGVYLREVANMTIGWKRGGGSNVFIPSEWPKIGTTPLVQRRNTPWSYMMNVCTHSYSLVWYTWKDWTYFLDWMSLSGINLFLAMTGQEEVQYKVFEALGVDDLSIRSWFNGPALLTWSRGQNEYGSNIAGPLPRSWMKGQYAMQKKILERSRSLGMSGQLPGFQGNVPIKLKEVLDDQNMTDNKKGTAWMDALDPMYANITDRWMKQMVHDFGTDHWWQLDGYFNGGTAPWLLSENEENEVKLEELELDLSNSVDLPDWRERGLQAYTGLNRTDPDAIWSFQGWAFVQWTTKLQAESLKSFIDVTPVGKFNVIDMSVNGDGEWKKWNNASFWSANFVWTTLHDFGGTDGMKGWLQHINEIPFNAPEGSGVWGTGFTPEGINQNPVYYEFMSEVNFREEPVKDIPTRISQRSHRRYGLSLFNKNVDSAWRLLVASSYSQDLSVQDNTGVPHIGDIESWAWSNDYTPSTLLCSVWTAWGEMIAGALLYHVFFLFFCSKRRLTCFPFVFSLNPSSPRSFLVCLCNE